MMLKFMFTIAAVPRFVKPLGGVAKRGSVRVLPAAMGWLAVQK
jgi:hypothetical protein